MRFKNNTLFTFLAFLLSILGLIGPGFWDIKSPNPMKYENDHLTRATLGLRFNPNDIDLDKKFINSLKENIQCGDININDVLQHVAIPGMKFGGVKSSGLGGYGGQFGFDHFSHKRSVFHRSTLFINNLAQPPYTTMKERLLKLFYR